MFLVEGGVWMGGVGGMLIVVVVLVVSVSSI